MLNCTFDRGSFTLSESSGGTWTFMDNIFDKTSIACGGAFTNDYNGYMTNYDRISTNGAHDVMVVADAVTATVAHHVFGQHQPQPDLVARPRNVTHLGADGDQILWLHAPASLRSGLCA